MADREYPLTPGQERMWFLQQLDPDHVSENMVTLRLLEGALDPVALGRAVDGLVARHEPLRATFAATEQGPVQRVAERVTVPVRLTDVTDVTGPAGMSAEAEALRLAQARGAEPYRLDAGPLVRVELFRTGEREHLLLLGTHHLVSDGWSVQLLLAELAAGYAAYVRGGSPETAPPAVGFGDHVMWQRARSAGPLADRALAHWSAELADPPGPGLSFCSPGEGAASTSSGSGHVVRARVPEELATAVAEAARARRCTPYMGWLALYQVLLARHTGRHDLVVGSPATGRERSEDERLVGCFTAILPLRADLSGEVSFDALLDRTRRVVTGALTYPQVPYERLLATLGTARDAGQRRLFQSWFNLHTEAAGAGAGEGVPWSDALLAREVESDPGPTPFATSLDAWPAHGGLDLVLGYDPADLDHATAAALVARLPLLAASAVAHPDVPVTRLSLLAPGERGALLWGPGAPEGREEPETVVGMLLRQAERTPDAVAVEAEGQSLTYRQLVAGARRTAAELHRCGVPQGSPVGLLAGERSVESLIGLWGVLLAGCGYLPLDPALPSGRIGALVRGAGVSALLACDAPGERPCLPGDVGIPVVVLPSSGPESTGHRAASDGLAYVLHTSGSTGEPKAVAVSHRALAARVRWMRQAYRLGAGDRLLQFAALDFDTHVEEVFPTLASGATLVLSGVPSAQLPDWLGTARARNLTVLDLPTAYWQELVAAGVGVSWPSALRTVILGGDQVEASSVAAWRRRFGDRVELWNTYGPTEATVIATAARLGAADALRRPGIGTPLSETGAYVLDAGREPVPTGVVGELWIAGAGLATGYLDADCGRFTADPYGPSGGRMYRTGDLARQRSDGTLEFLGRTDRQLKVRGRRVEPAEVEAALLRHPAVARALVDLHDADGRQTLVSWVVPAPTAVEAPAALPGTLLGHLRGLLPAHLVPDAVVLLDRLPLTTRGKPDRAALPAPAGTVEPASGRVPPRTDAELLVAEVWAEVLGLAEVGAHDDFFALGGHSLLVVRVVARLRAALGLDLPVRTLFTFPTVAGTAVAVEDLILADIDGLTDAEVDAEVDALILEGPAR